MKDQSKTKQPQAQSKSERIKAKQTQEETEGRGWTILENIEEGYYEVDLTGSYTFFNSSMAKILGYTEEEMMGMNYRRYMDKETATKFFREFNEVYRTGISSRVDYEQTKKDGSKMFLETSVALMRDSLGEPTGFKGIVSDITARRQMEESLRESEKRYRDMIENSRDMIQSVDPEGRFIFVNPAWRENLGYTEEEIPGLNLFQIIHPDSMAHCQGVFQELMSGQSVKNFQATFVSSDGSPIIVEGNVVPRMVGAHVIATHGFFRDITERRRTENEIQQNYDTQHAFNLLLRRSLENIPLEGIIKQALDLVLSIPWLALEAKGGIFLVEDEPEVLVMKAQSNLEGPISMMCARVPFGKCLCGRAAAKQKIEFSDQLDERHEVSYEGMLPHGHYCVPILSAGKTMGVITLYVKEGHRQDRKEEEFLTAIADLLAGIIARKRAEEQIRDYSENLEQMVEERTRELNRALFDSQEARDQIDGILKSVADGLIVTDLYNNVVLMNRAAEDLLGIRLSEVIDRSIDYAVKDETLRERIRTTLEKREPGYQFDFELPGDDDDHPRIMRARTSVIEDKDGKHTGIITIIHDVTYEREVDRMKTEFLSTAAHELRSPLTSIQGFSELLISRDDITEDEHTRFLSHINRQSRNLAAIISDLLDISRIESGRGFALKKVPSDIKEIVKSAASYFESVSTVHRFDISFPTEPVELMIDPDKVGQVMGNIFSNAVKYSPAGGVITVTGEVAGDYFRVSVEDEGIGMTSDQVEKIFDKFYRVDASNTAVAGTGLGMSIVKYIIEAHGGTVWVESNPGKGTTVRFTVPA